jgi:hypothetical protein
MIILEVRCNCCDRVGERGDPRKRPAHLMRADLRSKGWVQKGRIDFCPDCKPKPVEKATRG